MITREILTDDRGNEGINVYVDGQHIGSYMGKGSGSEHIEAKARLYDAALELLEALEFIDRELSQHTQRYMKGPIGYALKRAGEAIAKARSQ